MHPSCAYRAKHVAAFRRTDGQLHGVVTATDILWNDLHFVSSASSSLSSFGAVVASVAFP